MVATNLAAWNAQGQMPITFAQLLSGAGLVDGPAILAELQHIAGEVIWKRFFGDSMTVAPSDYVPFQLGAVLLQSLKAADSRIKEFEKTERAQDRFLELREQDEESRTAGTGIYEPY